ncbi:carboxypeptidase-like regulatory domain-containing protein, partial [Hymenobacter agri]
LANLPAAAQAPAGRTLTGTVQYVSDKGKIEPLPGATVLLAGTQVGISTDMQGHYELTLPDSKGLPEAARIQFSSVGFAMAEWPLPPQGTGALQHDALLQMDSRVITFSVRRPSLPERALWSLQRLFRQRAQ